MSVLTAMFVGAILLLAISIAYWLRQAHKAAKQNRLVFEPKPQAPATRDLEALDKMMSERNLPSLLKRQAG